VVIISPGHYKEGRERINKTAPARLNLTTSEQEFFSQTSDFFRRSAGEPFTSNGREGSLYFPEVFWCCQDGLMAVPVLAYHLEPGLANERSDAPDSMKTVMGQWRLLGLIPVRKFLFHQLIQEAGGR
jgi:hypothetical protein